MTKLHWRAQSEQPGVYPIAERGRDLKYLSFRIVELGPGMMSYSLQSGPEELSLDFYTGPVRVEIDGPHGHWSTDIPARRSFAEAHPMVYVPAQCKLTLTATEECARITIGGAEGKAGATPARLEPTPKSVGKDNWTRTVFTHIADNVPAAHLICGETVNRPGNWSSCPPHKHDRMAPPAEVPMEEIYYFQLDPPQGFGFIRLYTDAADPEPFDQSFAVQHGDTILIPRGYHPVVACPGYTLNYTWILAGEGRTYGAWSDDPQHSWIKD